MSKINIYQSVSTKKSTNLIDISSQLESPQKIVFIDSNLEDYQGLANGVLPGTKVVILRPTSDGVQQITRVLKKYPYISSIHIVSHGTPGCLYLGNSQLNINSINNDYCQELEAWSVTDLLLYSCSVAAGNAGKDFLARLREITGANIAASARPTGNAALGGDWELEVIRGELEVSLAFSDQIQSEWEYIMAAFDEQPYFYQVIAGQLKIFNPLTNNYEDLGPQYGPGYNATGYNVLDNFIYGIEGGSDSTTGDVVRINSDGTVEKLLTDVSDPTSVVTVSGSVNLNSGDVDDQGNLWVRTGNRQLTRINLTTGVQTPFPNTGDLSGQSLANVADIIYNTDDQKFYGAGNNSFIYTIDLNPAPGENNITRNIATGLPNSQYGAAWINSNNNSDNTLYIARNNADGLYLIEGFTGTSPTAVLVANAEANTQNDGVSNPEQLSPFNVPFIDPNPNNTNAPFSHEDTFTEGDTGVGVVSSNVDIKDFDGSVDLDGSGNVDDNGGNIQSATIRLTNPQTDDELFVASALPGGITATGDGSDVIILTAGAGGASATDFETALQAIQFRNTSDTPNTTPRDIQIQLTDRDLDDTEGRSNNAGNTSTTTINVVPVNDPPSFQALDGTPTFVGNPVILDGDATISDFELDDRDNYNGATLTLERNGGANAEDVFSSGNPSVLEALTEGGNLTVNGTTIGTVTTNSGGKLQLTFNSDATGDLVDQALQQIAYQNTNTETAPDEVTIKYTINDSNIEFNDSSANVAADTNSAVVIDANATISSDETQIVDYNNVSLVVQRSGGANSEDEFSGGTLGALAENSTVTVNGTDIATVTTNSNGKLQLTFNELATTALVNQALQQITYSNTNTNAPDEVIIDYRVFEQGIGGPLEGEGAVVVNVRAVNTAPSFQTLDNTATFTKGGDAIVLDDDATIVDIELDDRNNYDGAILTLERNTVANSEDEFSAVAGGTLGTLTENGNLIVGSTTIGTVTTNSGGTLKLTFNSDATGDLVDQALQQIAYQNTNTETAPDEVTIKYTINDSNIEFNDSSANVAADTNSAVVIDANATISSDETQIVDYNNVSLVVQRSGGANSEDEFSGGTLGALAENSTVTVNGTDIATVTTNSNGKLQLTFNELATTALVNQALQQITYTNT
ncbi:DUF4347 domain-containing protein, partial [Dapis sp. BLCC M126]|uniref:DUF4347 domain-containing protein n=1 Tax=Dapis sp. BLCC M126 TaxID=3400189 RepID=UPI003CF51A41